MSSNADTKPQPDGSGSGTEVQWREWGMFANQLTLARIVLTPFFVWWFVSDWWVLRVLSFAVFILAAITDWWDGHHARQHKTVTNLGKFLDPLADKLLTITTMVTFVVEGLVWWWLVAIIFVRDFALTWRRVSASKRNRAFTTLWLAKFKTMTQLVAIIVIIGLWAHHSMPMPQRFGGTWLTDHELAVVSNILIGATAALALLSGAQYFAGRGTRRS